MSIGRSSDMRLDLGMGTDGNLIAGLDMRLGLGPSLDIGMGVGMDADGIVNIFSSCCRDIFS